MKNQDRLTHFKNIYCWMHIIFLKYPFYEPMEKLKKKEPIYVLSLLIIFSPPAHFHILLFSIYSFGVLLKLILPVEAEEFSDDSIYGFPVGPEISEFVLAEGQSLLCVSAFSLGGSGEACP